MALTPFERCGGFARVRHLVADFYDRVVADPLIGHHFAAVDMERLVDHQTRVIGGLMGGPFRLDETQLRRVHAHLRITGEEFQRMADLLAEACADHGIDRQDLVAMMNAMGRCRSLVVAEAA